MIAWRNLLVVALLAFTGLAHAAIDVYEFDQPEKEERFRTLTHELRCPKCQNQNINDSTAPLAKDIKDRVFQQINEGKSNQEIVDYLVDRYGEFVTYRPRLSTGVALLWGVPAVVGFFVLMAVWLTRRNAKRREIVPVDQQQINSLLDKYSDDKLSKHTLSNDTPSNDKSSDDSKRRG